MRQRVIYPVSDSSPPPGRYLVYFNIPDGRILGGLLYLLEENGWRNIEQRDCWEMSAIECDFGFWEVPNYWEELPEFDQSLVIGGAKS